MLRKRIHIAKKTIGKKNEANPIKVNRSHM